LGLADFLTNILRRLHALLHIATHFLAQPDRKSDSIQILLRMCKIADQVDWKSHKEWFGVAKGLAIALVQVQLWEQAEPIWNYAETAASASSWPGYLSELIETLVKVGYRKRAEAVVQHVERAGTKELLLPDLEIATVLTEVQHWERAEAAIQRIEQSSRRDQTLCKLATALITAQHWEQAKAVIQRLGSYAASPILSALADALIEVQLWEQAEAIIQRITQGDIQAKARQYLSLFALAQQQWEQFEIAVQSIKDESTRAKIFQALGRVFLQTQCWEQVEGVIQHVENLGDRKMEELRSLVMSLAQSQQWGSAGMAWKEFGRAWDSARYERFREEDMEIWEARAHHPDLEDDEQSIKLEFESEALMRIFIETHQWKQAEQMIDGIRDDYRRVEAKCELIIALAQSQQWMQANALWAEVEVSINRTNRGDEKAEAARQLVTALAEAQQWEQAEFLLSLLEKEEVRVQALSSLAQELAKAHQLERARAKIDMIGQREDLVPKWHRSYNGKQALQELGLALVREGSWEKAEAVAREIVEWDGKWSIANNDPSDCVLQSLGLELARVKKWRQAEAVIYKITQHEYRYQALCALVERFADEGLWEDAQRIIDKIDGEWAKLKALEMLGMGFIRSHHWEQVEATMYAIKKHCKKNWPLGEEIELDGALQKLGMASAREQQWERTEAIIRKIKSHDSKAIILGELGLALFQAGHREDVEEAWQKAEQIDHLYPEWLSVLGLALAQAGCWERAEAVLSKVKDWGKVEDFQAFIVQVADVGMWERACMLACTLEGWRKADALLALGKVAIVKHQVKQIEAIIHTLEQDISGGLTSKKALADLLKINKNYDGLLQLIQYTWKNIANVEGAIYSLPWAVGPLIPTNEVGVKRTRKGFKNRQVAKIRLVQAYKQMPEEWLAWIIGSFCDELVVSPLLLLCLCRGDERAQKSPRWTNNTGIRLDLGQWPPRDLGFGLTPLIDFGLSRHGLWPRLPGHGFDLRFPLTQDCYQSVALGMNFDLGFHPFV